MYHLPLTNSAFYRHSVFMSFLLFSEKSAIVSLNSINQLIVAMEKLCIFFALRTEFSSFLGSNIVLNTDISNNCNLCSHDRVSSYRNNKARAHFTCLCSARFAVLQRQLLRLVCEAGCPYFSVQCFSIGLSLSSYCRILDIVRAESSHDYNTKPLRRVPIRCRTWNLLELPTQLYTPTAFVLW
jgi:hypothetical protein